MDRIFFRDIEGVFDRERIAEGDRDYQLELRRQISIWRHGNVQSYFCEEIIGRFARRYGLKVNHGAHSYFFFLKRDVAVKLHDKIIDRDIGRPGWGSHRYSALNTLLCEDGKPGVFVTAYTESGFRTHVMDSKNDEPERSKRARELWINRRIIQLEKKRRERLAQESKERLVKMRAATIAREIVSTIGSNPLDIESVKSGIYALLSNSGVEYIGRSVYIKKRVASHRKCKVFCAAVAWPVDVSMQPYVEMMLIKKLCPPQNIVGLRGLRKKNPACAG